MYVIVWRYRVSAERAQEFERAYGPDGDWARLFRRSEGYAGTELYRGLEAGTYLTLDSWTDEHAFARFRDEHAAAYADLDRQCDALTLSEERVGAMSS
jgi:heme-degrading monooxygenase HmoA